MRRESSLTYEYRDVKSGGNLTWAFNIVIVVGPSWRPGSLSGIGFLQIKVMRLHVTICFIKPSYMEKLPKYKEPARGKRVLHVER